MGFGGEEEMMMSAAPAGLEALLFLLVGCWMALLAAALLRVLSQGFHLALTGLHRLLTLAAHPTKSALSGASLRHGSLPPR